MDDLGVPDFATAVDGLIEAGKQQIAAEDAGKLRPSEVDQAISGTLPRRPVSFAYRLHLLLAAGAMAALPFFYICFVASVGFCVAYYVSNTAGPLLAHTPRNRIAILYVAAVAAPAIAGSILVLFLIKPLFFRNQSSGRRRSLTRQGEPLLFDLVDSLCAAIGAPKPTCIDVDYQVNASARPQGGLFDIATGKMVLTIGVPLLAGLSSRQLAGVLAHEFGHFSQKIGMGAMLVIRRVNWWFARVVYQRDAMDDMLEQWIADSNWWVALILQLASLGVFASRGVLWFFMIIGHAISVGLLRQMEFDADRYEYGLVGSKTFAETFQRMRVLSSVHGASIAALAQFANEGRLADDMLVLGQHIQSMLPPDTERKIRESMENEKASWLDTHPTDAARIARANSADAKGCFNLDRPARDLIRHYEALCKNVTWDFYRDQIGPQIMPNQLTPTKPMLARGGLG